MRALISEEDGKDLSQLAAKCLKLPGEFIEIGSYQGASAEAIRRGMDRRRMLYCFDLFAPEDAKAFNEHMIHIGENASVNMFMGDFRDTLPPLLKNGFSSIAFAFIDHDHELETTKAAYNLIWPMLDAGGILAFHDFLHPIYNRADPFLKSLPHPKVICRQGLIAFTKEPPKL